MASTSPASAQDYLELPGLKTLRIGGKRSLALAALLIIAVLSFGIIFLEISARDEESELVRNTELRLKISASGRADVLSEWLKGRISSAEPITRSDLFLLFAAEVDLAGADSIPKGALADQLPYMQAAMAEFARQADLAGAYLLNRDGQAYISSASPPPLADAQRSAAQKLFPRGDTTVLALRADDTGLKLDILVPLHPPQPASQADLTRTVGVLLMTLDATGRIADVTTPGPLAASGQVTHLLQLDNDKLFTVFALGAESSITPLQDKISKISATLEPISFARRKKIKLPKESHVSDVYSVGVPVAGAPWIVLEEISERAVLKPLTTHRLFGGLIVALATIGFAAAALAFWWRQGSENNRLLADQYRELVSRLQTQRQLLDSMNASIQEHISVKDREGTYIYANPAFAEAVGLPAQSVVGLNDAAIFEPDVAEISTMLDKQVLEEGQRVDRSMRIESSEGRRFYQIAKSPFLDDEARMIGVVSVARDITDLMEAQERRDQTVMNTIRALSSTVEAVDPHLTGHSHKLERFTSSLARRLGCSDAEIQTLEVAANLSQIGKLSVPPEILTKTERLSAEEQEVMQSHIRHADNILSELDFGLPVREVLLQMHERLDGSGYPAGLTADDIGLAGRILAVADVFVARTSPRSYRDAITSEAVIALLETNTTRYDIVVIEALKELLASPESARLDLDETNEA